jgi:uncharacterized membrane protein
LSSKSSSESFPNKFDKLPLFYKPKKSKSLRNPKKIIIGMIILFAISTGVIIGVILTKSNENDFKATTFLSVHSTTISSFSTSSESSTSFDESSTQTESLTTTAFNTESTTEYLEQSFEIVPKEDWNSTAKGKTQLRGPVDRIIILNTELIGTDECSDKQTCLKCMKQRQLKFVNKLYGEIFMENLPENFVVSSDGTFFEGRGIVYEGMK